MIRVLLADDHTLVREGLKQLLASAPGIAIDGEAGDGDAVLALVRANDYDIAVLDLSMPGLAGIELMHMIRKGQLVLQGCSELSFADQFYALAGKIRLA